jgi:polyisoprenoid-binding protein YceI
MQRKSLIRVASLLALFAAAVPATRLFADDAAAGITGLLKIDPVHSAGVYRITHLNTSAHWGVFKEPTGTIDVGTDGSLKLDVAFDLAKLDSGNAKRDEHLRGPDFFNAKQFPKMTFKSTSGTKGADGSYAVKGDLTIKGTTKPIEVVFKKVGEGKNPMSGATIVGYETEFTVNRLDYGVSYMPGALGNDVKVVVSLEAAKE